MACSCVEVSIYILVTSIMIIKTELYIMTMYYNISLYEQKHFHFVAGFRVFADDDDVWGDRTWYP